MVMFTVIVLVMSVVMIVVAMVVVSMIVMAVFFMIVFGKGAGLNAVGCSDQCTRIVARLNQTLHPALKQQSVKDHHICAGQRAGVAWAW